MGATPLSGSVVPARRRATSGRRWALPLAGCAAAVAAVALVATAPSALADTAWGNSGAFYSGGITCRLGSNTEVPMATWDVDGASPFATADVSETNGAYGPAPTSGSATTAQPGDAGLDQGEIGATAYLIAHHGTGSGATVAEVSADIAAAAGSGGLQSRCLGQHGTSRARARALYAQAQRYAGPYKIALSLPTRAQPGKPVTVGARVTSAAGFPTPGIGVTFAADGGTAAASTARSGVATTTFTAPSAPATPITATISEAVSLTYYTTNPGAVTTAAPTTTSATGTLVPVLHPTPHVSVHSPGLVLRDDTPTPQATITGTYGYSGAGSISAIGPLHPDDKGCSSFGSADYARAPVAWKGNFGFVGDGTYDAGQTSQLPAGCYAVTASISTTNTSPPAKASAGYGSKLIVSGVHLSESAGPGVVPSDGLAATITGTGTQGAKIRTTITVHGPLTPVNGSCSSDLEWSAAPVQAVSDPVRLTAAGAAPASAAPSASPSPASSAPSAAPQPGVVGAAIPLPPVSAVGCYALSSRSVITQDGLSIVEEPHVGQQGSTTLVARPTLRIADGDYDGEVGKPMTGTITVTGSYHWPGTLTVGLVSAPRTDVGCRDATFVQAVTTQSGPVVTSSTRGDGVVRFTTPRARQNLCYAVTAVLRLKVNPAVQATSPAPSTSSVFLAGVVLHSPKISGTAGGDGDALGQTAIAGGISLLLIFAVAFVVIARAYVRRKQYAI
ncbi:Ig-like domain-containing protein [uncultured Jatrophihabitans sp.]|uniref:Ig-like domain-containing protein n=1 Tax=uncultured Jatrophihabitans sp. TaxID=1610747 RepID=UPI0035CB2D3E